MNKILISMIALSLALVGCKKDDAAVADTTPAGTSAAVTPPANADATSRVVGTWKVDVEKTTIPATSDKDKADEAAMRVEFKADNTTSGDSNPDAGKWKMDGDKIVLTSDKGQSTPSPLTMAADGSTLTATVGTAMMVMVKA